MSFPNNIPSYAGFTSSHTLSQDNHASQHNSEQTDVVALATKVGTGSSTPTNHTFLKGNGTGASSWAQVDISSADITGALPDSSLSLSDITTNNASATTHGFLPKLPNDATRYLDGTGTWNNSAWTTYSPTVTGIGGTQSIITGAYTQLGKTVIYHVRILLGADFSITASPTITIPKTASNFFPAGFAGPVGICDLVHTGIQDYMGFARFNSSTVVGLLVIGTNGATTAISSTVPFTWVSGDELDVAGIYEAA